MLIGDEMRIPTDKPLAKWIRELIRANNLMAFYKSTDWLELKAEVLEECHYECQGCLKNGEYKRADVVHHVNHVRTHPHLALSKYYTDNEGKKQRNLVPLCNACHGLEHPEKLGKQQSTNKFTNEEKW